MAVAPVRFTSSDTDEVIAEKHGRLIADSHLPINGQLSDVQAKIRQFEHRYEMSSQTMQRQLEAGKLRETDEICQWLMLLDMIEYVGRGTNSDIQARG